MTHCALRVKVLRWLAPCCLLTVGARDRPCFCCTLLSHAISIQVARSHFTECGGAFGSMTVPDPWIWKKVHVPSASRTLPMWLVYSMFLLRAARLAHVRAAALRLVC